MVLLDIGPPDLNGYEVARRMRASSWGADLPLVAVTGWGKEEDRERAFAAGFNHHLTEPVAPDAVESVVSAVVAAVRVIVDRLKAVAPASRQAMP